MTYLRESEQGLRTVAARAPINVPTRSLLDNTPFERLGSKVRRQRTYDLSHSTQMEAWYEARRRARGAGGEAVLKDGRGTVKARNTYEANLLPKR
jgi:Uncharacterized protein conserved in bacteria (DUF2188)